LESAYGERRTFYERDLKHPKIVRSQFSDHVGERITAAITGPMERLKYFISSEGSALTINACEDLLEEAVIFAVKRHEIGRDYIFADALSDIIGAVREIFGHSIVT
jgi:hypothetical protein